MKAIILAAGYGNRMRPFTDKAHKTLLQVGNKTIIERMVDNLLANGIFELVVVTGYLADSLQQYLDSHYPQLEIKYVHNDRYHETNNVYSLFLAMQEIKEDEDILLIESDLVCSEEVIGKIIHSQYGNVALVDKFKSGMDGTVVTVSNGIITNIIPPHLQDAGFNFSDKYKTLNVYKFSKEFCKTTFRQLLTYYVQAIDQNSYYELILGILIYLQKETIYAEILQGEKWAEVDDPNDLCLANYIMANEEKIDILETTFGGYWNHDILDFYFIRNMYFPNHSIIAEMKGNLINLMTNYGSRQEILNKKLSYFLLCRPENLNILNGASQAYPMMQQYFAGQRVLIPDPTFGEYSRIFKDHLTYGDQVGVEFSEIEEKITHCGLVVFVNPNNPTGTTIPTEDIFQFAKNHPQKTVLVDESFIDFSPCPSIISLLEKHPLENVIVIKSLSKFLGVPGVRLGFTYSYNASFNQLVNKSIPIWNLNSVAEFFIEIILKHRSSLAQSLKDTIKDRQEFTGALLNLKCVSQVYASGGNFVLVKFKDSPKNIKLAGQLLDNFSIYTKDVSNKFRGGGTYFRFAVRLPIENQRLIACLQKILGDIRTKKSSKINFLESKSSLFLPKKRALKYV